MTPKTKEIFITAILTATTEAVKDNHQKWRAGIYCHEETEALNAEITKAAVNLLKTL